MVIMPWWAEYWAGVMDCYIAHLATWSPPMPDAPLQSSPVRDEK